MLHEIAFQKQAIFAQKKNKLKKKTFLLKNNIVWLHIYNSEVHTSIFSFRNQQNWNQVYLVCQHGDTHTYKK